MISLCLGVTSNVAVMGNERFAGLGVELLIDADHANVLQYRSALCGWVAPPAGRQRVGDQDVDLVAREDKARDAEVAVTGTETARMPGASTAARKPRLPGETILASVIGSPGTNGSRATQPAKLSAVRVPVWM